jgi:hypothetical protein
VTPDNVSAVGTRIKRDRVQARLQFGSDSHADPPDPEAKVLSMMSDL